MPRQIHEIYAELGEILEKPQAFGLTTPMPFALALRLKSLRGMLQEALREQGNALDNQREHYLMSDSHRG